MILSTDVQSLISSQIHQLASGADPGEGKGVMPPKDAEVAFWSTALVHWLWLSSNKHLCLKCTKIRTRWGRLSAPQTFIRWTVSTFAMTSGVTSRPAPGDTIQGGGWHPDESEQFLRLNLERSPWVKRSSPLEGDDQKRSSAFWIKYRVTP